MDLVLPSNRMTKWRGFFRPITFSVLMQNKEISNYFRNLSGNRSKLQHDDCFVFRLLQCGSTVDAKRGMRGNVT